MKVCIIRNAESRTNASMLRVLDALVLANHKCLLLTRSRYNKKRGITKQEYFHGEQVVDNYEINIKTEAGRGLVNIFQLMCYQFYVFKWLIMNKEKYEVIHSFDLDSGLPVLLAAKILKKKYVYHVADFYVDSRSVPNKFKKILRKLEHKVIDKAEATIICTEQRKEQIKGSKPKKLVVIHNVPSIERDIIEYESENSSIKNYNHGKTTLAYVGGLSKTRFIKSATDVLKKYPELNLELAGMGNLGNYVENTACDYENINYHGMISYKDAITLYSQSDIMFAIYDPTIPNHYYSAPNKVYEAMLLGKPIIVARGTGVDKLVEKEKMGLCIDYSKDGFEKALEYIKNNPKEIKEMGDRAKQAYKSYSWSTMRQRLIALYDDIESIY